MLGMSSEFSFHLSFFHIFCSPGIFFHASHGELPSSGNLQTWDTAVANAGEMLVGMSLDRN